MSEKSDLPVELLKEAVDTALPSEQVDSTPKASLDTTNSPEKAAAGAKDQVVAPKKKFKENQNLRNKQKMRLNLRQILRLQFLDKTVKQVKCSQQLPQLKSKRRGRQH